jgi:hypothetical protein
MSQKIDTYSGPIGQGRPLTGVAAPVLCGFMTVGAAAVNVGDLVSGATGFPVFPGQSGGDPTFPKAISLAVISTNEVRVTFYGQTPVTGATPVGVMITQQPTLTRLPAPECIQQNNMKIIASAGGTVVSWFLEY